MSGFEALPAFEFAEPLREGRKTAGTVEAVSLARPGDVRLAEEDDLAELARSRTFDALVGDATLHPLVKDSIATLIDVPEFAVSGRLRKAPNA